MIALSWLHSYYCSGQNSIANGEVASSDFYLSSCCYFTDSCSSCIFQGVVLSSMNIRQICMHFESCELSALMATFCFAPQKGFSSSTSFSESVSFSELGILYASACLLWSYESTFSQHGGPKSLISLLFKESLSALELLDLNITFLDLIVSSPLLAFKGLALFSSSCFRT